MPAGKKTHLMYNMLLCWIKESCAEIPAEMVQKSFKVCDNSNVLDGTEDDALNAEQMDGIPEAWDDEAEDETAHKFKVDSKEED